MKITIKTTLDLTESQVRTLKGVWEECGESADGITLRESIKETYLIVADHVFEEYIDNRAEEFLAQELEEALSESEDGFI